MIAWNPDAPLLKQLVYRHRVTRTQRKFFDRLSIVRGESGLPTIGRRMGYQSHLATLKDRHRGRRCFIVCNGPSLKKIDISPLKDEITIGCNGIYKNFPEWGFTTDYLLFEDIEQFEIRAPEVERLKGPTKMAAIYNSYALRHRKDWLFFHSPLCGSNGYYFHDYYPQFSRDFSSIVHLGGTVTYIMLQLAFFLGFEATYIVGLDHNYGKLPELFPPGKIEVTADNYELVQQCHFDPNYYKIGDVIGVPFVQHMEDAYRLALEEFTKYGKQIVNLSEGTRLDVLPTAQFSDVI